MPHTSAYTPDDIWCKIIDKCGLMDRAALACTSRQLRRLTDEPKYWHLKQEATNQPTSAERRDQWHATTGRLSSYGRYHLKRAFEEARIGNIVAIETLLKTASRDAEVTGCDAPDASLLWDSMLAGLLGAAKRFAGMGDLSKLKRVSEQHAFAAERCRAGASSNVFQDLEHVCTLVQLQNECSEARRLALAGNIHEVRKRLKIIQKLAGKINADEQAAASIKEIERLAGHAVLCDIIAKIENDVSRGPSYHDKLLRTAEAAAVSADVCVPERLYQEAVQRCDTFITTLSASFIDVRCRDQAAAMRDRYLRILCKRRDARRGAHAPRRAASQASGAGFAGEVDRGGAGKCVSSSAVWRRSAQGAHSAAPHN